MEAPPPETQGWFASMLTAAGAALTALGTWAWNHTHKRIDNVDSKVEDKAPTTEMNRQRDNIRELFHKVEELGDRTEVRFTTIEARANDRHIEILNAIHSIKR